jgi:hypothetical protein
MPSPSAGLTGVRLHDPGTHTRASVPVVGSACLSSAACSDTRRRRPPRVTHLDNDPLRLSGRNRQPRSISTYSRRRCRISRKRQPVNINSRSPVALPMVQSGWPAFPLAHAWRVGLVSSNVLAGSAKDARYHFQLTLSLSGSSTIRFRSTPTFSTSDSRMSPCFKNHDG